MLEKTATEFFHAHWRDALEILVLTTLFYGIYLNFRDTRGARMVVFFTFLLLVLTLMAQLLHLPVIGWLIPALTAFLAVATVVIFQPELRRTLANLGSHRFFGLEKQKIELVERLDEITRKLSAKRFGALFAIERRIDLKQFLETGVTIGGELSSELALTIFHPKTALHDGGMILQQDGIAAAGCVFPVSQREIADRSIGLRHRAGMGITEETDAIAIVVSEENGHISICHKGEIERDLDTEQFRTLLADLLTVAQKREDDDDPEKRTDAANISKLES